MKKLAFTFAFFAVAAFGAKWTGYVSDTKCGSKHNDGSQVSIDCVKHCIKDGAKPVLVIGDKVLEITNTAKVPESLYGAKVTVTGERKGDAVTIVSIVAAR